MVKRGEVYLINLDPTIGSEIQKIRPCVIVSPNEINKYIRTVIIAPMTTKIRSYKSRIEVEFNQKKGQVMLDQLRTIDKQRLIRKLGDLSTKEIKQVLFLLQEMFTY
ncbi:growth inhibitor [Xenococcus sp. PCC 7305]|uniref:type II toxin-antitoxin system PemK/MazF family toxin n=1 Tax=Xenococcus sp. PCC 7305 TaxID=102125 RepID=UPI0002AC1FF7|nr:type II toxin-antitoxin system PemK/MazF family toxin [Xenococcus sp. PCC 7305]ELS03630.1 growth inhibitor [Xenococcus sp. PCC 7305]